MRHRQAGGADRGKKRLVERRLPFGVGRSQQIGARRAADVVDQDVETAERLDGAADDELDARRGGYVRLHGGDHARPFRGGFDLERGIGELLATARAEHHAAALRDERPRAGEAEPAARAGDDGDFVG